MENLTLKKTLNHLRCLKIVRIIKDSYKKIKTQSKTRQNLVKKLRIK